VYINAKHPYCKIDCFCIMPNHVHCIVQIVDNESQGTSSNPTLRVEDTTTPSVTLPAGNAVLESKVLPVENVSLADKLPPVGVAVPCDSNKNKTSQRPGLPSIIKGFKVVTNKQSGIKLWQRNYFEHIIRNENDLYNHRKYISENPLKWTLDKYYTK